MFFKKLKDLMAVLRRSTAPPRAAATDPTLVPGTMTPFAKTPRPQPAAAPASAAPAAPANSPRQPVLKLKFGGVRHRVSAADGEIMIGRAPDAQILVSASHVSRHHATLIWDQNGYPLLVNLSQSGTSLKRNGEAPKVIETSCSLDGEGGIGLFADYAYAEANGSVVTFEAKWPSRS